MCCLCVACVCVVCGAYVRCLCGVGLLCLVCLWSVFGVRGVYRLFGVCCECMCWVVMCAVRVQRLEMCGWLIRSVHKPHIFTTQTP